MHPMTKLKAMYVMMHILRYSSCCSVDMELQFWQQKHYSVAQENHVMIENDQIQKVADTVTHTICLEAHHGYT